MDADKLTTAEAVLIELAQMVQSDNMTIHMDKTVAGTFFTITWEVREIDDDGETVYQYDCTFDGYTIGEMIGLLNGTVD